MRFINYLYSKCLIYIYIIITPVYIFFDVKRLMRFKDMEYCSADLFCYTTHDTTFYLCIMACLIIFYILKDNIRVSIIIRNSNIFSWMKKIIYKIILVAILMAVYQIFITTIIALIMRTPLETNWNIEGSYGFFYTKILISNPTKLWIIIMDAFVTIFINLLVAMTIFISVWNIANSSVAGFVVVLLLLAGYQAGWDNILIIFNAISMDTYDVIVGNFNIYSHLMYGSGCTCILVVLDYLILNNKDFLKIN